jgi:hypothetical protein
MSVAVRTLPFTFRVTKGYAVLSTNSTKADTATARAVSVLAEWVS